MHNNDETLHNNDETEEDAEITTHYKRYVSPEEDNKLSINKVSTKNYWWIDVNTIV